MRFTTGILGEHSCLSQLKLNATTQVLRRTYASNAPCRHLIFDDFFEPDRLRRLLQEIKAATSKDWVHHSTDNINKFGQRSALTLGEEGTALVSFLHAAPFLYFLSEVTGIWNLLPDPYLHGAGLSVVPKGAKFDVHIDRNADSTIGLVRRLAIMIYLNERWTSEDGGCLELWDPTGTTLVKTIAPTFNRVLLMEITETGYHGINTVMEQSGRSRYSFMLYYGTAGSPLGKELGVHSSIYAPLCYQPKTGLRSFLSRSLPSLLTAGFRDWTSRRRGR